MVKIVYQYMGSVFGVMGVRVGGWVRGCEDNARGECGVDVGCNLRALHCRAWLPSRHSETRREQQTAFIGREEEEEAEETENRDASHTHDGRPSTI
jgi:hypothetical protein